MNSCGPGSTPGWLSKDTFQGTRMALNAGKVRQFIRISDGRIGVVMANDRAGGVFRGHCDLWFGELENGLPRVELHCVSDGWVVVECPLGISAKQKG